MVARDLADNNPDWPIAHIATALFERGYKNNNGNAFSSNDVCHLMTISESLIGTDTADTAAGRDAPFTSLGDAAAKVLARATSPTSRRDGA